MCVGDNCETDTHNITVLKQQFTFSIKVLIIMNERMNFFILN